MKSGSALLAAAIAAMAAPAFVSPVMATPRDDVRAGSERCDGIANDRTWLDCYYGAAQPLRSQLGLPPAPASQQMLVPAAGSVPATPNPARTMAAPAERPGFFGRLLTHTEEKAEPPTRMVSYKFESGGFFVVQLANGETWKQVTGDSALASWHDRPGSYTVTILPAQQLGIRQMKVGKEIFEVEQVH
jgi:uncharacterized membrane protein